MAAPEKPSPELAAYLKRYTKKLEQEGEEEDTGEGEEPYLFDTVMYVFDPLDPVMQVGIGPEQVIGYLSLKLEKEVTDLNLEVGIVEVLWPWPKDLPFSGGTWAVSPKWREWGWVSFSGPSAWSDFKEFCDSPDKKKKKKKKKIYIPGNSLKTRKAEAILLGISERNWRKIREETPWVADEMLDGLQDRPYETETGFSERQEAEILDVKYAGYRKEKSRQSKRWIELQKRLQKLV